MIALLVALALLVVPAPAGDVEVQGDPERGAYVAHAGGCAACHTLDDGPPYAGGYAIETDFGRFYATNLTPDPDHGIGDWTRADFVRAMRRGRSPEGRPYYPSFPYTSYTGMTDQDLADLWAWLQTLEPIAEPNRPHELKGLYGWRFLLRFWKLLEFRRGVFEPDPERSEAWNRGAYLVRHAGHCGECHTPRNGLGGLKRRQHLAGSDAPPEPSPNITPHPEGIGDWSHDEITWFLEMGMLPDGDYVGAGMGAIIDHTEQLTDADRAAIATYLLAVEPRESATD